MRSGSANRSAASRLAKVGRALEAVRRDCDITARRAADPVAFAHETADPLDRELVALVSACLAFGNVTAMRPKIRDALDRLGPSIHQTADDPKAVRKRLAGWKHRVYIGQDLAGVVIGARALQRQHQTLGGAFAQFLAQADGDLQLALSGFANAIRTAGKLGRVRSGARHILPDAASGSAAKRLLLFLRWMIRPADGVDLGMWSISPAILIMPVDTHIHKLSHNLGFTTRKLASWKAAEDITAALRRYDPSDPVKYDFALCHLGMVQNCPSKPDPEGCAGCGVKPVCRHWT